MTASAGPVAGFLRRLSQDGLTDLPDGELLARFLRDRDEAAFAQLLRRHGPMVLGAARRVLANTADAEDVTQAVFLILARRAGRFTGVPNVGGWLHGVAVRTALHAKSRRHRRRVVEARAARPEAVPAVLADDLAAVVDRAVQSLPAKLRDAVVLCDLEGQSRQQAADRLGVPLGTVSSRLAAAHVKLAAKLARPFAGAVLAGVTMADALAGATLAAVFTHDSRGVPAAVSILVLEVTRMMWLTKVKLAVACGIVAVAVGGVGVGAGRYAAAQEPKPGAGPPAGQPSDRTRPIKRAEDVPPNARERRQKEVAAEVMKLSGTWAVESATVDGKAEPRPEGVSVTWVFDGIDKFDDIEAQGGRVVRNARAVNVAQNLGSARIEQPRYRVNPFRTPKELDLANVDGAAAGAWPTRPFIYELAGDTLRVGFYRSPLYPDRPRGFAVKDQPPGSPELTVAVLKRVTPAGK